MKSIVFDVDFDYNNKKDELISTPIDPLVLSVAFYRHRYSGSDNFIDKFYDIRVVPTVTDEDCTVANQIRDYYSKKIMWWKLSGKHLSKFRSDLAKFLSEDNRRFFNKNMGGIIFRLPEFYRYDVELDRLVESHTSCSTTDVKIKNSEFTVKYLTKLSRKTRFNDVVKYWFTDESEVILNFTIDRKNILLPMFESIATTDNLLKMKINTAHVAAYENFKYWNITSLASVNFNT